MNRPAPKRATYQDIIDAPDNRVAEILNGILELSPRPTAPHAQAASVLGEELGPPFKRGKGGPGGWIILYEPEVHFSEENILVSDLAGWRRERMPKMNNSHFAIAPNWVCEVISPSTASRDRVRKMPIYAVAAVGHVWLVDPLARTLEVYRLEQGRWVQLSVYGEEDKVRAEPFDAIELDLSLLWQDVDLGYARSALQP